MNTQQYWAAILFAGGCLGLFSCSGTPPSKATSGGKSAILSDASVDAGAMPTGGVMATGGSAPSGGASLTGGVRDAGGTNAKGGLKQVGGGGSAGNIGSGGATATGGVRPSGGSTAAGGSTSTGGGNLATAQRPFPQNIKYPYGFIPTTIDANWLKLEYERWISTAFTTCSESMIYVTCDNHGKSSAETTGKAEAIGFGLWTFAFMGARAKFDALYAFYKKNCNDGTAGGMMGWLGTCDGNDFGMATDGEIDVAFALVVASWQWPEGGYLEKAKKVLENIKKVIVTCGDLKALAMGIDFGGCQKTDISYYNPAAFREFAKVVDSPADQAMWNKLAEDTYTILNAGTNPKTGLVANQQTVTGEIVVSDYKYDACRTPWRICLDYLWNGNEKARIWCKKISDFAYNFGIPNIKEGFTLDGSPQGSSAAMSYVGGFAIAAMANSQAMVDEFGTYLKTLKATHWFPFALTPAYLITLTGNQWRYDLHQKQ